MSELLMLDIRTLAFVSSISGFLMATTMAGIYYAGMRTRAVVYWCIAGLSFGLGFMTGHLLQTLEFPIPHWVAGALANSLIGLGHGMVLLGVQSYLRLPTWKLLVAISVAIALVSVLVFPELRESLRLRVIVNSGWYVFFDLTAGILLLRAGEPLMRRFHVAAATILLAFGLFLAMRLGYALISPALTTSFVQDPFQSAAFLNNMIFGYFLTMALAVMLFREKQVELMSLARKDPLTGLNNRLSLDEFAVQAMDKARTHDLPLSIILLDIDHFKRFNDDHGHQAGDKMLRAVAERINGVTRGSDTAFRFGGEEFLILLPGAAASQAARVAERFRTELAAANIEVEEQSLHLTASFGVVEWRSPDETWNELVRRADLALYQAKNTGRDRVVAPIHVGA